MQTLLDDFACFETFLASDCAWTALHPSPQRRSWASVRRSLPRILESPKCEADFQILSEWILGRSTPDYCKSSFPRACEARQREKLFLCTCFALRIRCRSNFAAKLRRVFLRQRLLVKLALRFLLESGGTQNGRKVAALLFGHTCAQRLKGLSGPEKPRLSQRFSTFVTDHVRFIANNLRSSQSVERRISAGHFRSKKPPKCELTKLIEKTFLGKRRQEEFLETCQSIKGKPTTKSQDLNGR